MAQVVDRSYKYQFPCMNPLESLQDIANNFQVVSHDHEYIYKLPQGPLPDNHLHLYNSAKLKQKTQYPEKHFYLKF